MSSLTEFLHMGGYAFYVWSSYAVVTVTMVWIVLSSRSRHRRALRDLAGRARRAERDGAREADDASPAPVPSPGDSA